MNDQVMTVTIKGIGDFSDVVNNVGSVQKALTKLKLPDKLGDSLSKNITAFYKEYEKYQKKITEGIKTQGDYNQVEKSLNNMRSLYQAIGKDAQKLTQLDMKDMLNLDTGEVKKIMDELTSVIKQIGSVKIDTTPFNKAFTDIRNITKNSKITGDNGLLNQIIGSVNTGQIAQAKKQLQELENYAKKVAPRTTESGTRMPGTLSAEKYQQLTAAINLMNGAVVQAEAAMNPLIARQDDLQKELEETKQKAAQGIKNEFDGYNQASDQVENLTESLKRMHQEEFSFNREAQNIDRQIQSYFGLSQMIRKVGDIAKDAFATVKELDKAMTETAVVTNFSVGDMWDMLPTYTQQANQLGSTIKDVYDAATLYYQQGLNTNQAMSLANETLKMARIAGLDAADATNMMTAALRGFNMEINQQSAQKINDIYSELAAITASDTKEIGSAMERTASIANSANMDFATTSAFLAQMIETTREAPENLGTAMKTIVARFQEMKKDPTKLIDSEGVAMDVNKVDTALKSIGVSLTNTKGEFRDLDEVFLDISAKWDSLSQGQQRYIATIAAGSRQQSRFIAMMSNYERTMELVDAANNSAGASQRQFEKTLDSMGAKLNMLKNAWDQFTMGLMNNQILKFGVDALTEGFTIVNKFIDILGKIPPKPFEGVTQSILTLITTLGMLNFGKKASRSLVMGGISWWQNGKLDKEGNPIEGGFFKGVAEGWGASNRGGLTKTLATINTNSIGYKKGQELAIGLKKGFKANNPAKEVEANLQSIKSNKPKVVMSAADIEAEYHRVIQAQLGHSPEIANATKQEVSGYIKQIKQGKMTPEQLYNKAPMLGITQESLNPKVKEVTQLSDAFEQLGGKVSLAGSTLVDFGAGLGGPVGSALTTVGSLLMTVGNGLTLFATESVFATAATEALGTASWFSLAGINALGAGVQALWAKFLASPLAPIIAAIAAIAGVAYGIYRVATADARALEAANDAAAAASEAYDSAKQETSELADSITKIQETNTAFDGLVAGTAEFNEQLVIANEQIMALIDKYPMLMDANKNYVTTDANGLMHISEAGFKAVKEYQKQIQANASAMNIIQTADLNALENQQKAEALRNKVHLYQGQTTSLAAQEEYEKNQQQADLLEQRAQAEVNLARSNAIRTALADKELHDVDALTSIYTNLYETKRKVAETEIAGLSKHDVRQQYADYHGYTYNKSSKKITDIEGNEVDYDDKVIKDEVIEQTVLLDFEANASTLEGVLNEVDAKFADTLDSTSERSSYFISDVLANNINTDEDILEKALSGNDFQDAVNSMTEKEMAAILGINAESINEQNIDAKRDEIVDLLMNNATKIAEAQSKSYEDLATMMAQSKGWDTFDAEQKTSQDIIRKEIRDLTAEQAHMMSDIGSQLKEGAGMETMQTYINRMGDLYKNINESSKQSDKDAAKEIEDIFNSVDLTSATGRLEAYIKMADSASNKVRKLGEDMRASAGEANLLGQTFDEFLGGDWLELAENADDFKNSLGQIDAAGILKASEQSHTLKTMLDSGETSASGLALALQGVEDGKFSIGAVNDSVLQLLSSLNRVEDEALKAHELIANFDAGIDYGEASDFAKENAEKVQEYWDNGEYGNQQLQNYIKLAAGQERWNEAIKASGGDLEKAEKGLLKYVTTFKDGFQPVIDQLVSGKGIDGDSLNKNIEEAVKAGKLDETLAEKFKQAAPRIEDGNFIFGPEGSKATDFTTEELKTYLEQVYGVSTEYAQLILEEWTNLSPDLKAELSKNDLMEAVGTESFKESHGTNASGQTILTDQEISILEQAGGEEVLEKVATDLGYAATEQKSAAEAMKDASFKVLDENGNRIDNTGDPSLLQSYIKTFNMAEKGSIESLFKTGAEKLFTSGTLDLSKLIQDTQAHGFDQQQAMQAAWQAYQRGEQIGEQTSYDGVLLDKGIATYEQFTASIENALEAGKWQSIGESIAQGIINFIESKDPGETAESTGMTQEEANAASAQESRDIQQDLANKQGEAIVGFFNKIGELISKNPVDNDPKTNSALRETDTENTEAGDKLTGAGDSLTSAANEFVSAIAALSTAGESLTTAASNLTNAAAILASNSPSNGTPTNGSGTIPGIPQTAQPNQSSVSGAIVVDNSAALQSLNDVYTKATDTAAKINEGASFTITTPGAAKLNKAAKAAQKITKNAGSKDININATATGLDDTKRLTTAVTNFRKLNNKTIKLKSDTSGLAGTIALTSAAKSFIRLSDHTITLKTIKKTITENDTEAKGRYNHGYYSAPPRAGSAARGHYGQVGPKGRGGLTLTGELGYEVAWLPDENRSMILGANGPQMINLPGNAVVWNHEQSEEILKQKAIPAGSHFRIPQTTISGTGTATSYSKGRKGSSGGSGDKAAKEVIKITQKAGKVLVWWENAGYRMDKAQRNAEGVQRKLEALLKTFGTTAEEYKKAGEDYRKYLKQQMSIAEEEKARAETELNYTDKGRAAVHTDKVDKARERMEKAEAAYNKHRTKENKKAWKKAQKSYRKAANAELAATGARREISYEVTKTTTKNGKKKKTKETRKANVNLAKYIKVDDATGAYIIDQAAIDRVAKTNQSKAEAIAKAAEQQLNDLNSKLKAAEDARIKAQEALAEFYDTIYETFYAWEKTITSAYILGQQLENLSGLRNIYSAVEDLEFAKIEAGFGNVGDSLQQVNMALSKNKDLMLQQVNANRALIDATYAEWQASLSMTDTLADAAALGDDAFTDLDNPETLAAVQAVDSKKLTLDFLKSIGGIENFDYNEAINALNNKSWIGTESADGHTWTESDYSKIKEGLDSIAEKQTAYYDAIAQSYESMAEVYQTIEEYQAYMADFEKDLISGMEEQANREIDKLSKLNDSLDSAAKDLIDEVKRKLDERRKQEDNAKTEQDIAQKQQRLASLRADTSGGHQVEIAQLQKEIAEAQQSYGRTLEDQLLDKLSEQQDQASKQRERQIQLLEAQRDFASATGLNVQQINEWLQDPKNNEDQIRAAWLANQGYENAGEQERKQLEEQFDASWMRFLAYGEALPELAKIAESDLPESEEPPELQPIDKIQTSVDGILKTLEQGIPIKDTKLTVEELKTSDSGQKRSAGEVRRMLELNGQTASAKEFEAAGYSLEEIVEAFSDKELEAAGYKKNAIAAARLNNYKQKQLAEYRSYVAEKGLSVAPEQEQYGIRLKEIKDSKTITTDDINSLFDLGKQIKRSKGQVIMDIIEKDDFTGLDPFTWEGIIKELIKAKGANRYNLVKTWPKNNYLASALKTLKSPNTVAAIKRAKKFKNAKNLYEQYKTGGLADYTGPAWLDGTPSKPELVLNATDTQNFLALRDVLDKAINSVGSVNNSYGGNATYEININVDKIEKDYDVDRVAERVKKIIVKDSGYRNVTQVRNFR